MPIGALLGILTGGKAQRIAVGIGLALALIVLPVIAYKWWEGHIRHDERAKVVAEINAESEKTNQVVEKTVAKVETRIVYRTKILEQTVVSAVDAVKAAEDDEALFAAWNRGVVGRRALAANDRAGLEADPDHGSDDQALPDPGLA